MKKLQFRDGLLYTSVMLKHGDKEIVVEDVIIDTEASHTIILTDYLTDLDVGFSDNDELVKSSGYGGIVAMTSECGDTQRLMRYQTLPHAEQGSHSSL